MRLTSAEFVDRSEQLAVLDALWADVAAGVGRVAVVVGEAGIGKTRLLDEFVARSAQQAVVLRGGCVHVGGEALPLAPFRSALRSLLGAVDGRRWAPGELFDAVAGRLIAVSAESPVLLAAEDLHWADGTTLELVDYLARGLRGARVLLLVNVRDDLGAAATEDVLEEVTRLPHAVRLVLPRLTPEGVIRVMQGILGAPPDAGMAQRVAARSGGVPFLVEELTAAERSGERGVPEQLHGLLLRRTVGLSAGARGVLEAAAAASAAGVDEDTLEAVTGMASEGVQEALRELIVAGLLTVDRDGGLLAFRHALLREAVEQDMLPSRAAQLHRRYAQLLDSREPDDPRAVIEAAYHWWLAGDPQRAYQASLVAADRAHALGAFADELLLLQHALALHASGAGRDRAQAVGPDRPELRARAAAAALQVGEYALAYELFEAAWRELGPTQRPARVARVLAAESRAPGAPR